MADENHKLVDVEKHISNPSPASGRGVGERDRKLNFAKTLRCNSTEAEQRLWYHLRAHRFMGLKFKRQKPIGPFIADFICLELRLVIELDGGQHGGAADARRDAWFEANGYSVLRFWNNDVLIQTAVVLEYLRQAVIALSPTPLPQAGEGGIELGDDALLLVEKDG